MGWGVFWLRSEERSRWLRARNDAERRCTLALRLARGLRAPPGPIVLSGRTAIPNVGTPRHHPGNGPFGKLEEAGRELGRLGEVPCPAASHQREAGYDTTDRKGGHGGFGNCADAQINIGPIESESAG